jgi:hypothetical protein
MQLDEPVNTGPIANADPTLNGTSTAELDLQLIGAKKNLAIIKKDTQIIIREGGKVNKKHLQKAIKKYNDLLTERKKFVKTNKTKPVVNEPLVNTTKPSNELNITTKKQIKTFNDLEPSQQDSELAIKEARLIKLRTKQNAAKLPLNFLDPITGKKDTLLEKTGEELDEVNSKSNELKEAAADFINCTQGN